MFRHRLIFGIAAAIFSAGSSSAFAADMAARTYTKSPAIVQAIYDWSGFYIGGHVGGAWTDERATYLGTTGIPLDPIGTQYGGNRTGFLGGVQGGYNYQVQNIVLGVAGDFSWTGTSVDNATTSAFVPAVTIHTLSKTNWYSTFTGRIGYAANNVLFYAKGGVAFAEEVYGGYANVAGVGRVSSFNNVTSTRSGYVVGGGIEYGFAPNWTAFAEYNYLDFGRKNYTIVDTGNAITANFNIRDHVDVVKVGVNYKFGGPVVARY